MKIVLRACPSVRQKFKWLCRKFLYILQHVYFYISKKHKLYSTLLIIGLWLLACIIFRQLEIDNMEVSGNYLRIPETNFYTGEYLVSTSKCRIPDLKVWSLPMLSIVKPLPASPPCDLRINSTINGTIKGLTSVDKETLVVSQAALVPLGLSISDIECCYQVVERVEQNLTEYNWNADTNYRFSNTCYPMEVETQPISGFVRVTCNLTNLTGNGTQVKIHTDFHLLAILPKQTYDESSNTSTSGDTLITRKLEYWKKRRSSLNKDSLPPNVLIIGMDTTSRLNFKRVMPRVESLLRNGLKAVELKGYSKIGINTLPNVMSLLTSYSKEEWKGFGFDPLYPELKPWDNCSLIWKNFSDHNYLTAYVEDYGYISTFNYDQIGFVKKPTDLYLRPWSLAAYDHNNANRCVGYQRADHVYFQYIQDLVRASVSHGIPFYIFSWFSDNSHDSLFDNHVIDRSLKDVIHRMKTSGWLDNTVLIVMSDHGVRYLLNARQSLSGWYEINLPTLWIKVGEKVEKGKEWVAGLRQNSNQLVTVYDIHQTFKTILGSTTNTEGEVEPSPVTEQPLRGVTLFKKVPDRSCKKAGIYVGFCVCTAPVEFKGSKQILEKATRAVIDKVNSEMITTNSICKPVVKYKVTAAVVLPNLPIPLDFYPEFTDKGDIQELEILSGNAYLVCGINIFGGLVQMEVLIGFNVSTGKFYREDTVLTHRINKISNACFSGYV